MRASRPERLAINSARMACHVAVRRLGDTAGSTRQDRPGRLDRVDGVGLAEYATKLTVGAIDLDHLEPLTAPVPRQAGAIGAGAFHSDTSDRPEAGYHPCSALKPCGVVANDSMPNTPPLASSAAATWVSRCVSTPPVIGRVSTMVIAIPSLFKVVRGGTHVP
jgi:hypothetical protein